MRLKIIAIWFIAILFLFSCAEQARKGRLASRRQQRVENAERQEKERIERATGEEYTRAAREIDDKYINNSLQTGATPYSKYYGGNTSCTEWGCSQIRVITPDNSDVLVTIKKDESVVRHAYICASSSYTFEMPNGTYQPFFYYGKGWNPEKEMKRANNTTILGGFVSGESFGKDSPQSLNNNILEYQLIVQPNGNFSTQPSNSMEAL